MKGQIVKIISNDYTVESNNKKYLCKARGILRKRNVVPKVGDYVSFNSDELIITDILERKNDLERPSVSNIDQAFLITSLKNPNLSLNLLDKLLVLCYANKIKPVICFTKKDLLTKKDLKTIKPIIKYYKKIGYEVVFNTNLRKIKKMFKNKVTVFTGQTGAGKSTLFNRLDKNLNFETGEISKALGRGKHTTRYVTLVNLFHGKVLDTPGFSALDLTNFKDETIKEAFIEFKNYKCPYKDCKHILEKECLVKRAVNKTILKSRYDNYKKFIEKR